MSEKLFCVDMAIYIYARSEEEAQDSVLFILERGEYETQIFSEDNEIFSVKEVEYE